MAERKQGPVKPPTIDLTAREAMVETEKPPRRTGGRRRAAETVVPMAETEAPAAETALPADEAEVAAAVAAEIPEPAPIPPSPPPPPVPPEPRRTAEERPAAPGPSWTTLLTAAAVGALLGTALTYVLATIVPLPGPTIPNLAPELSAQADRLTTLEQRLGSVETGTVEAKIALDTASADLAGRLAALEAGLADVRAAVPAPTDTTALETRLRALSSRVDAIAAGASSADAGAIAENIGDLEQGVAALQTEIDALNAKRGTADTALSSLERDVAAIRTELEAAAAEPEPVVPEPSASMALVASGLETAFATGRPFATELASLATNQPPIAVDEALATRAGTGLVRPDVLDQQFVAAVPLMLAAKPTAAADWQQTAGDWLASLLAIRPVGEMEGASPEAVISRLEGAMSRYDYGAASALFAELPPEMVAAAGTVPADIAAHAAAAALVADLRAKASAP